MWTSKLTRDWDWDSAAADSGDALRELWAERVNRSRGILKAQLSEGEDAALSQTHPAWGRPDPVSLRWVLAHMIEEYARHNGHADLIRKSIDGQTGDRACRSAVVTRTRCSTSLEGCN